MATFLHSGSLGDVIYALPTMRALGGGILYLNAKGFWGPCRGVEPAGILAPLLETQHYIHSVQSWDNQPITYNLDVFRQAMAGFGWHRFMNIADITLLHYGLATSERDRPWLDVPVKASARLVISRPRRWRSLHFNWGTMLERFNRDAVFIGLPDEHGDFEHHYGKIPHIPTASLYEAAQIIAGCEVFAGSQSCPYTLAEAMKKPVILEVSPDTPNGQFYRPGRESYMVYP